MSNQNLTTEQPQFILNRVKHTGIDALDIIPYSLSVDGLTATPVSTAAPLPVTATVSATDLDIRDLTSATDSVEVKQATHDNLNLNANMQVGNADVSFANPVPATFGGPGTTDSFGHVITGEVNNDIDVQFYRSDGSVGDIVTETNANSGTATASNGMATFASAASTTSSRAKGVSLTNVVYTAGSEVYAIFTAGFTGTGSGTSYHRIGLYNDYTNGFYIGYEGGTFGVSILKGGSATQTAKADFSVDTLTGAAGSKFTRAGTPEAINLALLNVWRIRFGWVGSAPIHFEVLSPDGNWVTFHTIKQPNLTALPSINTADLSFTCDVNSGNLSGNALTIITNCWGAGTTQKLRKITDTLTTSTLAGLTRSVITGQKTSGGGPDFVNVKVNPSGALAVAATASDGDVYVRSNAASTFPVNVGTVNGEAVDVGAGTEAAAIRVTLPTDGTGKVGLNAGTNAIGKLAANSGVDIGDVDVTSIAAGNNIIGKVADSIPSGATKVNKTVTATTAQTGTAIITPTSGKTLYIQYIQIQAGGTTAGTAQVWFGASADTTYTRGTDTAIFDGEFAPSSTLKPGFTSTYQTGWTSGTANDVLRYTTSAAMTITITVHGYEI